MKQLFVEYKNYPDLLPYVFNIPWEQNIVILQKIKDYKAKEYYLKATAKYAWGRTVLINQIKAKAYEYHLENPSIGIILCAEKDNFEVEFSLKDFNKPIGVAEYQLTKELPNKLKGKLPSATELKQYLKDKYGFENNKE